MASNKLVIKCGNFAVLVDLHVLPRGSSTDTSWFSDPEKEKVCMLLKDPIDLRVKQYMESRKHQGQPKFKEFTQCNPLFLKGDHFRIAAYFMKRWVNLRCVLKWQYRELRVFPYRFVVCASLHEPAVTAWTSASGTMEENVASGTSEYFGRCTEKGNLPSATKRQQDILKDIMKKTKIKKSTIIKSVAQTIVPVSADSKTEQQKHEDTPSSRPCEVLCITARQPVSCVKATSSSSDIPVSEAGYFANLREAEDASSQLKPHITECSDTDTLAMKLLGSSALELSEAKESQGATTTKHKRRRHLSDENVVLCKKAAHGRDRIIPGDVAIVQEDPMRTLDPELSKPNFIQTTSLEMITERSDSGISIEHVHHHLPISCNGESSVVHSPPNLKITCNPPKILLPENVKKIPNQPRKLKLQRTKK